LKPSDCAGGPWSPTAVDFDAVGRFKSTLLDTAWKNFTGGARPDLHPAFEAFGREHSHWLDDYALFSALKTRYEGASYLQWPDEIVRRRPAALDAARRDLTSQIDQARFAQFLVFRQGARLKAHARAKGVRLIGDLPFFVSPDSSDVWASPELFLLDAQHRPRVVAGVPPDYFSPEGQRWGNRSTTGMPSPGWLSLVPRPPARPARSCRRDSPRSLRAFAAAWHVPADSPTARVGDWYPARAPISSERWRKPSAFCRSSPKTWGSSPVT
jgi:4-alpha-glucanotransferase